MCSFSATSFAASKQYLVADIISKMMEPGLFEEVLHETMPRGHVLSLQRGYVVALDRKKDGDLARFEMAIRRNSAHIP